MSAIYLNYPGEGRFNHETLCQIFSPQSELLFTRLFVLANRNTEIFVLTNRNTEIFVLTNRNTEIITTATCN